MSQPKIAVLDYGIGNLRSAQKGFERAGADARLTADPVEMSAAADGVCCRASVQLRPVCRSRAGPTASTRIAKDVASPPVFRSSVSASACS